MDWRKKRMLLFGLSALFALVLSACKVELHTRVNEDGSGEFEFSLVVSEEHLIDMIDQGWGYGSEFNPDTETPLEFLLNNFVLDSVEDACAHVSENYFGLEDYSPTKEAIESGGGFECHETIQFDSLEDLEIRYNDFRITNFTVDIDEEGNFYYQAIADAYESGLADVMYFEWDYGLDVSFIWKVTVPGKITSTNGSQSGNTVTWELGKLIDQSNIINMEVRSEKAESTNDSVSENGGNGGVGVDTITILIIAVAVVAVVYILSQKK